jgi:hypothetical protein
MGQNGGGTASTPYGFSPSGKIYRRENFRKTETDGNSSATKRHKRHKREKDG